MIALLIPILLGAAVIITIGYIKSKMAENNIKRALVTSVNQCKNQVSIKDLETGKKYNFNAENNIDNGIYKGMIIEAY